MREGSSREFGGTNEELFPSHAHEHQHANRARISIVKGITRVLKMSVHLVCVGVRQGVGGSEVTFRRVCASVAPTMPAPI